MRELEREIQRAVVLAGDSDVLLPEMLFWKRGEHCPPNPHQTEAGAKDASNLFSIPFKEALDQAKEDFSIQYVKARLHEARGNKARAAALAGMQAPNFHRLMRKLGI